MGVTKKVLDGMGLVRAVDRLVKSNVECQKRYSLVTQGKSGRLLVRDFVTSSFDMSRRAAPDLDAAEPPTKRTRTSNTPPGGKPSLSNPPQGGALESEEDEELEPHEDPTPEGSRASDLYLDTVSIYLAVSCFSANSIANRDCFWYH